MRVYCRAPTDDQRSLQVSSFNTAFIGAGNMASSIIGGLLNAGFTPSSMAAADPIDGNLQRLRDQGIERLSTSNGTAIERADVIVLAVKPQVMEAVCADLAGSLVPGQLILSIAAGIGADSLAGWLGGAVHIVRCMPNTPALLGAGASALCAHGDVPKLQKERASAIMEAVGVVRWVDDEAQIHAVTALSGSGPAYFFQFMEAMIAEGQRMGLDSETARTLCAQTCLGAGQMLVTSDVDAAELRRRVTSPGGTTERAVASFEAAGLAEIVAAAMRDAEARSVELARELA